MTVSVKVRAQALGGKFLGPMAGGAAVVTPILNNQPGTPQTIPNGASGTVQAPWSASASQYPIVVQPPSVPSDWYPTPGSYWVLPPDSGNAHAVVKLDITQPQTVVFSVTVPSPTPGTEPATALLAQVIVPGVDYMTDPGIVIPIPGLYVAQLGFVQQQVGPGRVFVTVLAKVTMLCGCPITRIPRDSPPSVEEYWPSSEFEVTTSFFASSAVPVAVVPLECVTTDWWVGGAELPTGTYTAKLLALQHGTANRGSATQTVALG